jgi:hypothetical protein
LVLFLENKYLKWYFSIVENARNKTAAGYKERHHIIPKCMGGTDTIENLVDLTAKEHFICHLLLVKAVDTTYKKKMNYAFWRMCNGSEKRYKPSSRFYEMGKLGFVESQTGHAPYLLSHTDKTRKKIGESMSAGLSRLSKAEMKQRMLNSCCDPSVYTEERAFKISRSSLGKSKSDSHRKNMCKKYIFISPTGETFEYVGLNTGCKIHNLNHGSVKNYLTTHRLYKGWEILHGK